MLPNKNNYCAGAYPDWLDVCLIDKCNGKCKWCMGKIWNYKPPRSTTWKILSEKIISLKKNNVVLVGGEPTLYKNLGKLIDSLYENGIKVYVTTNGSKLTAKYVNDNLTNLYTINISIHHWDLMKNKEINGLNIKKEVLQGAIKELRNKGIIVRFTCNLIKGYIDNIYDVASYIEFSRDMGATDIRLSELQYDEDSFVDVAKLMNYQYGLNDEPFTKGCCFDTIINGMPVRFKQVCGCLSMKRPEIIDPVKVVHTILYYDGNFSDNWKRLPYTDDYLKDLISGVMSHKITIDEGMNELIGG
jgi:pyruvate-formate lyase-activating enzyme